MTRVVGKINTPRRFKNSIYRKNLVDIYNTLLVNKKMSRINYQIFKSLEFTLFKRMLRYFSEFSRKRSIIPYYKNINVRLFFNKTSTSNSKFKFINKLNSFNNNMHNFVNIKKNSIISNNFFSFFLRILEKRKGKLGYLNWNLFHAQKSMLKRGIRKRRYVGWLFIPKRSHRRKGKNFSELIEGTDKQVAAIYGFNNLNKFRKLLHFLKCTSKIRRQAVLNMEGRINILLYRLNLVSSILTANKLIKRGLIKINNRVCDNVGRNLKLNDSFSINFKIYKFIINIFKKRLKNKDICFSIPSYIEANFVIMHFALVSYPQTFDLLKLNNELPLTVFNTDIVDRGMRHFEYK